MKPANLWIMMLSLCVTHRPTHTQSTTIYQQIELLRWSKRYKLWCRESSPYRRWRSWEFVGEFGVMDIDGTWHQWVAVVDALMSVLCSRCSSAHSAWIVACNKLKLLLSSSLKWIKKKVIIFAFGQRTARNESRSPIVQKCHYRVPMIIENSFDKFLYVSVDEALGSGGADKQYL